SDERALVLSDTDAALLDPGTECGGSVLREAVLRVNPHAVLDRRDRLDGAESGDAAAVLAFGDLRQPGREPLLVPVLDLVDPVPPVGDLPGRGGHEVEECLRRVRLDRLGEALCGLRGLLLLHPAGRCLPGLRRGSAVHTAHGRALHGPCPTAFTVA